MSPKIKKKIVGPNLFLPLQPYFDILNANYICVTIPAPIEKLRNFK